MTDFYREDFTASVLRFKDGHRRECWRDHVHRGCIDAGCWQQQCPGEIYKVHRTDLMPNTPYRRSTVEPE